METTLDISRKFYRCLEVLNKIPELNNGGCGISALSMYRWLEKNNYLQGDEKFLFLYRRNDDFYENNKMALSNNAEFCSCAHILFYFNGSFYDSNGKQNHHVHDLRSLYKVKHTVTEDQLIEAINNRVTWNNDFRRSKYVSVIENKLGISLSDIDRTDLIEEKEETSSYLNELFEVFEKFASNPLPFQ